MTLRDKIAPSMVGVDIGPTAEIVKVIRPVYNFKAGGVMITGRAVCPL